MRVVCPIGAFFSCKRPPNLYFLGNKKRTHQQRCVRFCDVSVNPVISYKLYSEVNLITSCETVRSGS